MEQREYLEEKIKSTKIVGRERKLLEKTKLVKVVTGVRRCGKSFFTYLSLRDENFGYANFDDERILNENPEKIILALFEIHGKDLKTLFFDEIQNLSKWEIFVNRLHREGFDIFITGSNAKLLSSELATHLTGRHIKTELFPFSFREYLSSKGIFRAKTDREKAIVKKELGDYINAGGFPEVVVEGENPRVYMRELFSHIIERDVVFRKRIKYVRTFKEIAFSMLSNISAEVSANKIKKVFKLGSDHTAKNYLEFLRESYLFFFVDRLSFKPAQIEGFPKKLYCIDTSFYNAIGFKVSENLGRLMENVVAVELLRRKAYWHGNWEIFYFKSKEGYEVDFVVKDGLGIKQLIQVSYASGFDEVNHREIRALLKAKEMLKCEDLTVITWDYEDEREISWFGKKGRIKFVPLWKWLLKM